MAVYERGLPSSLCSAKQKRCPPQEPYWCRTGQNSPCAAPASLSLQRQAKALPAFLQGGRCHPQLNPPRKHRWDMLVSHRDMAGGGASRPKLNCFCLLATAAHIPPSNPQRRWGWTACQGAAPHPCTQPALPPAGPLCLDALRWRSSIYCYCPGSAHQHPALRFCSTTLQSRPLVQRTTFSARIFNA